MKVLKKIWSVGWRIVVCVVLLLWIFHSIFMNEGRLYAQQHNLSWEQMSRHDQYQLAWTKGPQDLGRTLRFVKGIPLLISSLMVGVTIWLGVVRWRMVLETQGLHLSLARATKISFVAQFFNSFLLGSTGGDFIKAYYAARETHHQKTEAVTTVFVDRLVGLWAMLFFACVMMIPNWHMLSQHNELLAPSLFIFAMLVALTVMLRLAFWGGISKRFPQARQLLRKLPKGAVLEKSLDSCRKFGKEKPLLLKSVAISLLLNFVWVLQISILGDGLSLQIPFMALLVIVPTILCISAIPVTPNGLGVRENLFVIMLGVIAIPRTAALSVSLLASAQGLLWNMVGGIVYFAARQKDHLKEVTHTASTDE